MEGVLELPTKASVLAYCARIRDNPSPWALPPAPVLDLPDLPVLSRAQILEQANARFLAAVPYQTPSHVIAGGGRRLRRTKEDDASQDEN